MSEGINAILAMYALQTGGGCEGHDDAGLRCELTKSLGLGAQCSEKHLKLVRSWFKNEVPKNVKDGSDYFAVNSKGAVPALRLDNGQVLTEGPVILQYVADQKPETHLAPKSGTLERYRVQEWLNFITSEIHKGFSPMFNPTADAGVKEFASQNLQKKFDWLNPQLAGKKYLTGDTFTIADAYLFVVLNWTNFVGIDLAKWPALKEFQARVAARPKVQEAMAAEGLKKN
jgi:glutathione S-transferase